MLKKTQKHSIINEYRDYAETKYDILKQNIILTYGNGKCFCFFNKLKQFYKKCHINVIF